ncbi:MAG: DUF1552 domain-containing protein [Planctomycetota bacterium]
MNASSAVRPDNDRANLARRRFLKGLGVAIALPSLESLGQTPTASSSEGSSTVRTAFIYVPNGAQQDNWFPSGRGADFKLNTSMKPLESLQSQIQVISGLDHQHAESGPDGAGDHARANATFLTGMRARKTSSSEIHLGQSIDQVIAERIGPRTRFSSLELTCDSIRKSGRCDSGYSCAYQYNISWRTPVTPMSPEPNPRKVFERLFGQQDAIGKREQARRRAEQKSLLDFVLDDARSLQKQLGKSDLQKVDEYVSGIRELEMRIERMESFPKPTRPDITVPEDVPQDYAEHIDIMFDLLAVAFQTDMTRVATLLLAHDGSNRAFPELGIQEGHHYLTHRQEQQYACERVAQIDFFYVQRFARFLQRLADLKEPDGRSVLQQSMIVYGSGISDANRHTHDNLPVILAGQGGGQLQAGQFLQAPAQPMSNLFLALADRVGLTDLERFGDSTERLTGI